MPQLRSHLTRLLSELKRRKVLRVLLVYVIVAWLVIQVVATTWEALYLPRATLTVIIILAVAGLPVVLMLAWTYELVPDRGAADSREPDAAPVLGGLAEAAGIPTVLRRISADAASAPGRGGNAAGSLPDTLPSPSSPFIGRTAELREVATLLDDARCRLVTVTGPGGVGKTRLVLEAAQACGGRFRNGVAFVPLSGLPSSDLLAAAIAHALGISITRRDDPRAELIDFLREKQLLLVLDNFEHLTSGASLVASILEGARGVHVLVTSRERLGLRQETLLPLGGLALSDAGSEEGEAAQLFVATAQRIDRQMVLDDATRRCVARICELLSGMPLAIELAASWVRVLSCAEIVAELERGLDILASTAADLPERHRSMRATFESSWTLLSTAEQRALARLAVFRSSFDRAAAHAVADADAELLRALLDKSLLNRAGGRFLMLDVVRQFAGERLRRQPGAEASARERHARYHLELLAAEREGVLRADPVALSRVADVIDEVRAAWSYAAGHGDVELLQTALDALFHFYEARGWAREGATSFAAAAGALNADDAAAAARPHALLATRLAVRRAVFCDRLGDHAQAESLLRTGLATARGLHDPGEIVFVLQKLGANRYFMGDYDGAERAQTEARLLAESRRDAHALAWALTFLGNIAWSRGNYDEATRLYHQALTLHRQEDDRNGLWMTLNNLGAIAGVQGDHAEARQRFGEALKVQVELGNRRSAVLLLHNLGVNNRDAGAFDEAREQLDAARAIAEEMGYEALLAQSLVALAVLALRQGALGEVRPTLHRALRMAAEARNYPIALEALLTLARLRLAEGDRASGTELARIVCAHPASEEEAREAAAALLDELGIWPPADVASADDAAAADGVPLEEVIDEILASEEAAITTVP